MPTLFFILALIAFIGLIVGLVKPSKVKLTSRKKVILWFGGSFIVLLILVGATSPSDQTKSPAAQDNTPAENAMTEQTPEQLLESSYKSEVKKIGSTSFSYREMKIDNADSNRPAGSKMVTIKINIDDFLSRQYLIKNTSELSSNLFKQSIDSSLPITDYIIQYYAKVKDAYGNENQDVVMSYASDKDTIAKINWSGFDKYGMCDFLKSLNNVESACIELVKID